MHSFFKKANYDKYLLFDLDSPELNRAAPSPAVAAIESSSVAIAAFELHDTHILYPFFPGFQTEHSFFNDGDGLIDPLPAPHIKDIVQVFDELGIFELKVFYTFMYSPMFTFHSRPDRASLSGIILSLYQVAALEATYNALCLHKVTLLHPTILGQCTLVHMKKTWVLCQQSSL